MKAWNSRKKALLLFCTAAVLLCAVAVAGMLLEGRAMQTDFSQKNLAPSLQYPFGTDWMGRDMLARTLTGLSLSIRIGVLTAAVSAVIALAIGIAAALLGPKVDAALSWCMDLVMGIPHILLVMLISLAFGRGFTGVVAGVALSHWPSLSRVIRGCLLYTSIWRAGSIRWKVWRIEEMRTLYIECNMGAAGDMLLAALYELLEDKSAFLDTMNGLGLPGVHLEAVPGTTCGIAGTHMRVTVHGEEEHEPAAGHGHGHAHGHDHAHPHEHAHAHAHHHATPGHIAEIIDGLTLPDAVKQHARSVYDAIAVAEAKAHGCPVGDVHYHEVGALDAVADVTGVCYALHLLQPERVVVSPIHVGSGTVRCAHGVMPVPAPATANLLTGVPIYGCLLYTSYERRRRHGCARSVPD